MPTKRTSNTSQTKKQPATNSLGTGWSSNMMQNTNTQGSKNTNTKDLPWRGRRQNRWRTPSTTRLMLACKPI
jgi:hypothetical protein